MSATKTTLNGLLRRPAHLTQPPHFRTLAIAPMAAIGDAQSQAAQAAERSQLQRIARANTQRVRKTGG